MRGCAWEHIWLSIHIHQSRWFPWAPSLCSAKWSAEALLTYNRFREFTAFYNSTTGIGWVRMSYAPAMYVKKFSQCLNLSRHRMGSERAVVLRSGVTDVGKAYKVNSKSTWHLRWRCDVSPHKLRLCMRRTKSQGFRVDCGGYPCVRLHVDGRMCFNANLIFSSLLSSFSLQWKMKNGNLGGRPDCCRCSRHHEPISNGPGEYILCRCVTNFEGLIFDLHRKMINDCSVTNSSGTDMDHNEWISLAAQLHTIKWLTWSSCANCWINCARKYAAERDPFKHIPCRDYALIWSRNIYDDLFGMPAITSQPNKHAIHANWLLIFPYKGDCGRC